MTSHPKLFRFPVGKTGRYQDILISLGITSKYAVPETNEVLKKYNLKHIKKKNTLKKKKKNWLSVFTYF